MLNKIDIPGTTITLEIVDKTITITNKIEYDMQTKTNTRKELEEAGFGEVFNSPLFEVEEVE